MKDKKVLYEIESSLLNNNRFIKKGETTVKVIPESICKEIINKIISRISEN